MTKNEEKSRSTWVQQISLIIISGSIPKTPVSCTCSATNNLTTSQKTVNQELREIKIYSILTTSEFTSPVQ